MLDEESGLNRNGPCSETLMALSLLFQLLRFCGNVFSEACLPRYVSLARNLDSCYPAQGRQFFQKIPLAYAKFLFQEL